METKYNVSKKQREQVQLTLPTIDTTHDQDSDTFISPPDKYLDIATTLDYDTEEIEYEPSKKKYKNLK